jgi:hypothetical protein
MSYIDGIEYTTHGGRHTFNGIEYTTHGVKLTSRVVQYTINGVQYATNDVEYTFPFNDNAKIRIIPVSCHQYPSQIHFSSHFPNRAPLSQYYLT